MNNTKVKIIKFDSRDELFTAVAEKIENDLSKAIIRNGKASFIVPGGTTPAPAFKLLSNSKLDWKKITIAQSDERWLDANHSQSNERLSRENLLINHAKLANYVSMKNDAGNIEDGQSLSEKAYSLIPNPFTICMLGMGLDGHVASLFPGSENIRQALSLDNENQCIAIDATGCSVAGDYPHRMSLTLSAILKSETILLLVTGKEKLAIIENALNENQQSDLPISHIINQSATPVEVFWCD